MKSLYGFTLLEVIITLSILVIGIVGISYLITQTIAGGRIPYQKLIAAYLAQEGIEIVRNIRDTNWIEEENWDSDLLCGTPPCDWEADYTTQSFINNCGSATNYNCHSYNPNNFLKIDNDGFYNYSSGTDTKFKRKITISEPATPDCPAGDCLSISVVVEWEEKGKVYKIECRENLYNWR